MIVILYLNHLLYPITLTIWQAPSKMASEMGLEALQTSTCYKMAGRLKVVSYKMALDFGGIWALRPAFS